MQFIVPNIPMDLFPMELFFSTKSQPPPPPPEYQMVCSLVAVIPELLVFMAGTLTAPAPL